MLYLYDRIRNLLANACRSALAAGALPEGAPTSAEAVGLERPKVAAHGDLATNLVFELAKPARKNPRQLAEAFVPFVREADTDGLIAAVEVAGPGFINLRLTDEAWHASLRGILADATDFGRSRAGEGRKVLVEFVSANPTGPLHVGHGRGAVTGDALARVLEAAGFTVSREYYINNIGNQVAKLGESTWHWLRELAPLNPEERALRVAAEPWTLPDGFPEDGYRGRYIAEAAARFADDPTLAAFAAAPAWEDAAYWDAADPASGGRADNRALAIAAWQANLAGIRVDLAALGITFDRWFSERSLHGLDAGSHDEVHACADALVAADWAYLGAPSARADDDDDAPAARAEGPLPLLFRGTREDLPPAFRDDKDRVILRSDGRPTYFASDIAYHDNKFRRGFETCIDILGADHHGYIPRLKGVVFALGAMHRTNGDVSPDEAARWKPENLEIPLVQMVTLLRGGQAVPMGKRSGDFVTLRDVLDEVSTEDPASGRDAVRFIFLMRKGDAMLDFDLEVARKTTLDNPVFYVQYGHARLASILRRAAEAGHDAPSASASLAELVLPEERDLALQLATFPEVVTRAARSREPHQIAFYLTDVTKAFHGYYTRYKGSERVISDDRARTAARLVLVEAVRTVVANALSLLGVTAPQRMLSLGTSEAEVEEGGSDGVA